MLDHVSMKQREAIGTEILRLNAQAQRKSDMCWSAYARSVQPEDGFRRLDGILRTLYPPTVLAAFYKSLIDSIILNYQCVALKSLIRAFNSYAEGNHGK